MADRDYAAQRGASTPGSATPGGATTGSILTGDGQTIVYDLLGQSGMPVVILAHSLGTDAHLWDPQIPALTQRYRVLRYDARGHGRSSVPAGDYSLARLGRDALDLMDGLGLAHAAFCGISLGGMVGQWLGYHAADRLTALALCNTSADMGPPRDWTVRIETVRTRGMAAIAHAVLARWFTADFLAASPPAVQHAHAMLLATSAIGYAGSCAAIRDMDLLSEQAVIGIPTQILAGRHDTATPPAHAEALKKRIPLATLSYLPAAHLSNLELPDAFTEVLTGFLQRSLTGPSGSNSRTPVAAAD